MKDLFSKNFLNLLALVLIFLTFAFDTMFLFVQYPERNHDTITMIAGVLNTVGFASVVSYFYGSSQGSKSKQDQLDKAQEKTSSETTTTTTSETKKE